MAPKTTQPDDPKNPPASKNTTSVKTKIYSSDRSEAAKKKLKKMSDSPKPKELNLKALIQSIQSEIEAVRQANYSWEEIAAGLREVQIEVSATALKRYLRKSRTQDVEKAS